MFSMQIMFEPKSYWALVTVKDGQSTIWKSVESIAKQSVRPSLICVVDDGSKDSTPKILLKLKQKYDMVHIITLPDNGYDSRRIVCNWNLACDFVRGTDVEYDYHLIGTDDVVFPIDYVYFLMYYMNEDPLLAITSGSRGLKKSDYMSLPEGAGRLIRMSFFWQIGFHYPPYYGYEAWILYKALELGYKVKKIESVTYDHLRKFGVEHKFVEYAPAMRCLGYHPLFVIARTLRNIFNKNAGIPKLTCIRILFEYFFGNKWHDDHYYILFEPKLRKFVRDIQKKRLLKKIILT